MLNLIRAIVFENFLQFFFLVYFVLNFCHISLLMSVQQKEKHQHKRKRAKTSKKEDRNVSSGDANETILPALTECQPAKESFMAIAGTYERILYGIEGRFVGKEMTLNPRFIFPAHIGCIKAVSAGGRYLASGSTDEVIKLYDLKKRIELGALHEHKGSITALQFHGSTHLLSASEDGAICIFRTKDWEPLKVLKGHKASVTSIAIHPSGKLALSVAGDRTAIVWNLLTGQKASRTKTPQNGEMVVWNRTGTHYAISYATEIQMHAVGQPEPASTVFCRQRILCMLMASFEDKDYILAGGQDKRIHIYSAEDGTELGSSLCHENRIKGLSHIDMTFPDNQVYTLVVSISSDGRIKVWKLEDMIRPLLANDISKKDDAIADLEVESLAVYNADSRLTCVATSNDRF